VKPGALLINHLAAVSGDPPYPSIEPNDERGEGGGKERAQHTKEGRGEEKREGPLILLRMLFPGRPTPASALAERGEKKERGFSRCGKREKKERGRCTQIDLAIATEVPVSALLLQ